MSELAPVTAFLGGIPPFDQLAAADLEAAARRFEAAYYRAGRTVLSSEPPAGLAVLRKGAVRLLDERGRFLEKRSEGEWFGHSAWLRGERKAYRAEAEEDSLVWHLPQTEFEKLCAQHPPLARYFDSQVTARLGDAAQPRRPPTRLGDLVQRPAIGVDAEASVREAAERMTRERVSSVLVLRAGQLVGILTDRDLRQRVLAPGRNPQESVAAVMTAAPEALPADAELDAALLVMMRRNCHHLPVLEQGRPVGVLTAGDVLRAQSEHPLRLVSDIHRAGSVEVLTALSARRAPLFTRMVALGRDAEQVGRMTTRITDAFTVRLLQLGEDRLGGAPMRYAWLAFGSQAREEQAAVSDQDNGLLLEREPDPSEAEWFGRLADFVCGGLDRAGYAYCPGEVMALNPKWRGTLAHWRGHFDGWIDEPEPRAVMHSSIFFDLRCVHGDRVLADALLEYAVGRARENSMFLRFMAANALHHRPPLGFFRQFVQEHDGSHSEGLNLKHRGIVPIVDLARLRALECGLVEANSWGRLEQAVRAGGVNEEDAASLRDALSLVSRVRLDAQADQLASGDKPGNHVPVERLSPLLRRNLKAAFMLVASAQQALAQRYQLQVL